MQALCGCIDLNTHICGSTRIYAGIVATLVTMVMIKLGFLPPSDVMLSVAGGGNNEMLF